MFFSKYRGTGLNSGELTCGCTGSTSILQFSRASMSFWLKAIRQRIGLISWLQESFEYYNTMKKDSISNWSKYGNGKFSMKEKMQIDVFIGRTWEKIIPIF